MSRPDLSDDELERSAIAARVVANQHAEQALRVTGTAREHFREQSKRYRALAQRFEDWRQASRGVELTGKGKTHGKPESGARPGSL